MIHTPPTLAGLFFCLASDTVQGFYFARMQYSPIQAFTACFVPLMQLYRPRHKTARRALQWRFLRLHPFNRPRYQTDTSGYNTTCATLERLPAPGYAQPILDTTAASGRCTAQHRPPIIIRYIRGQTMPAWRGQLLPSADRWQVLHPAHLLRGQRLHLYRVSPAASRCFPRPAACSLAPGQRSGRAFWPLHPAGQSSSRGAAGGAEPLAATAASLFGLSPDNQ